MNVSQLAAMARDHWKQEVPDIYMKMVKNKVLAEESEAVARLTLKEMENLMKGNMAEQEAWQASLRQFIFAPKEQIEKNYQVGYSLASKTAPLPLGEPTSIKL